MTKTIARHRAGEPLPSADWNDAADSIEKVWPNSAGEVLFGTGPSTAPRRGHLAAYDIREFGAVVDGTTDDRVAVQAGIDAVVAAGGGRLDFPSGQIKLGAAIQHQPGVWLNGMGSTPASATSTKLVGTTGQNVIELPATGSNVGYGIGNLIISGGLNGIYVPVNAVGYNTYLRMRNVHISSPSQSCMEVLSRIEEWELDSVSFYGGQYGFRYNGARIDKCWFIGVETRQQSLNGWSITASEASQNLTWVNPIFHLAGQHAFVVGASVTNRNWIFINAYAEGTGQTGKSNRTTGSITTGTATLTVASGTGLANSDPIVVQGAGANGVDLFTTISSGGGTTTLTLAANASTTVTSANVTNGSYDDFSFPSGCNTGDVIFLGGLLGNEGTGGHVRYAIDARGAVVPITLIGTANAQPAYDPLRLTQVFGGANVRQPANFTGFNMQYSSIAGPRNTYEMVRTLLPSPPGRDLVLALRDSTDNTSGTFGNLEVRKNDSNKTAILQLRGDVNRFTTRGPIIANGLVGPITLTANSATPDVSAGNSFQTANTGATTITNFTTGLGGQVIKIRCTDANTTVSNNATIKTNTGANKLLTADKVYTFTLFGTVWVENE